MHMISVLTGNDREETEDGERVRESGKGERREGVIMQRLACYMCTEWSIVQCICVNCIRNARQA